MVEIKNYDGWGNEVEIGTEVIRHPSYRQHLLHFQGWSRTKVMEVGKITYFKNRKIGVEWPDGNIEEYDPTCIWKNDRGGNRYNTGPINLNKVHNDH